jgi:hypothetical protein
MMEGEKAGPPADAAFKDSRAVDAENKRQKTRARPEANTSAK